MDKITSLVEARKKFSTQEACEDYLARMRWPEGVTCPRCGSKEVTRLSTRKKWQCKGCRYQFSVTAGTIFHKTYVDLPRWMMAMWLMCHSPKGVSSAQIQRELGVTYKTAWYMTRRLRVAISRSVEGMVISGDVEVDEAVVHATGGRATGNVSPNTKDVIGFVSRDQGTMRLFVLDRLNKAEVVRVTTRNVADVQRIYSDGATRLKFLSQIGMHQAVAHYFTYVDGVAHVNHVESAWSLFKRGLVGVYHHVSAKWLQGYLDEFAFRGSHRQEKARMMELVLASC